MLDKDINVILIKQMTMEHIIKEDLHDNKEEITQESLQPKRINPGEKAYQSVRDIEERLQKGDATNIALTGPYGSGKSSILITLKEDFPQHHYLNISLATLKPSKTEKDNSGDETAAGVVDEELSKLNLDRLIEYSILQQLIYKEKQDVLPNSRFKRIFHLSGKRVCEITVAIILAVLATVIVFEPNFLRVEWLCKLFGKVWMNISGDSISIIYLLWFAYKAMSMIVPAVSNSRLNKLNLKDGEIEIVENTSIFNKHLDEILYFFEKTDYNVVMLEDLDRFESTDIFLKLRELNLLLNESKVIERKIFFVYAVRDDMFKDAERVKCFDYITTVIPVINRSNAKDQLKEELRKRGVTEISDYHLQELGFFLYDMRLLKNIANEYVLYREKVSKGISSEKLLGMIVYKNYHPKDFADLHDCKGVVYQLLNLKETFVSAKIAEIEEENKRKREQQELHLKERHLKETELRRIYLESYRERMISTMQNIKVGDNSYSVKDIAANEKLFEKLISNKSVKYTYIETNNGYYRGRAQQSTADISFSDIEQSVNPSMTYRERLAGIRTTYEDLNNATYEDIKKEDIRSQTLSQIMSSIDYGSSKEYQALEVPKLIEYLVVRGYIDENYYDYISYFYGNFIDARDWDFVLDMKLNKTHPYDYHINNAESCVKEIPGFVFRKHAILNIDLLNYLAAHAPERENQKRLRVILRTAIENKKYDFLAEYYQKGNQQDVVFELLYDQHKNLWSVFEKNDDAKQSLKLSWYKYAEKEQSCDGSRLWLNSHYSFITDHLLDIEDEQWSLLIREGKYEFVELDGTSRNILKTVAEKNAYALSRHNVETLVSCLLDMNLEAVSYRLVCETEHKTLIDRVEDNLGQCMKEVFAAPEAEKESEDAILGMLLSTQATENEKIAYLLKQQNKINLEKAEQNDIKILALKCDVVEPSWENVVHYMNEVSEKMADEPIIKFVNKHASELSMQRIDKFVKEDVHNLMAQFVSADNLSFEAFTKIVECFYKWHYENGVPAIEERRVMVLNEKGMVYFTTMNTESIIEQYSASMVIAYLLKHKREWLKQPENVAYGTDVAIGLMKSSLTMGEKTTLIPCFDQDVVNSELADEIIMILSKQEIKLDVNFLLKVMTLTKLSGERLRVLNYTLEKNSFDEEMITSFIKTLHFPYKYIAEKGKKPEISNDDESWKLVRLLKEKDYISSYSETKKGIRVNTKLK